MFLIISCVRFGLKQWRIILFVYLIQLLLAGILGIHVYKLIESTLGHSLELNKLLWNYDHTVIGDLIKEHSGSVASLMIDLSWIVLVWLGISTFLNAGLLLATKSSEIVSIRVFVQTAASAYFPFLKITLCLLFMMILLNAGILMPVLINFEFLLSYFDSEKYAVYIFFTSLILIGIILMLFFIWSINSRLASYSKNSTTLSALRDGWNKMIDNKSSIILLLFVFIILQFCLCCLFSVMEQFIPSNTGIGIAILFLVQQFGMAIRVSIRVMVFFGIKQIGW